MSCNIQHKWCKAEATNYEFGKHIFMPASDRIISKVSIWILDYPFSQHPRFESRVVTKQRRNCCKMLSTLECFGRIWISNKSLLSSRIYRQATEFWILAMMLIIRIRTENWTEKLFLKDGMFLLYSWAARGYCCLKSLWEAFVLLLKSWCGDQMNGPLERQRKRKAHVPFQTCLLWFFTQWIQAVNAKAVRNVRCERFYIHLHHQ